MKVEVKKFTTLGALAVSVLAACGDDAGPGGDPDAAPAAPLYVIDSTTFTDTGSTTYFSQTASLGAGTEIDYAKALEVGGSAKLYAPAGVGWFGLGGGEAPTITRYELGPGDTLVAGTSISLQPQGTTFLGDTVVFVSPTKAYYFDSPNLQLVIWNPTAMTVDGTIDLGQVAREGFTAQFDLNPLLRDDGTLLLPISWSNFEALTAYPATGLAVIDTATDSVRTVTTTDRCHGVRWSAITPDGALYAASAPFYAAQQRVKREGAPPCVLRIQPGADDFDPTFTQVLADLAGGRVAGGIAPGPAGQLFFRALDPAVPVGPDADVNAIWSAASWQWWRWDLAANTATEVTTLPLSAAGGLTYRIDDKVFATDSAADWSSTTLIDMTAAGGPAPALTARGYVYGVARLR